MQRYRRFSRNEPITQAPKETISGSAFIFIAAHIPLALIAYNYKPFATFYAWATILLGLIWALNKKNAERVVYITGYIMAAEVLWRMTKASIFWEGAKYAIALILLIALLQKKGWKANGTSLLYFILLLPSTVRTISAMPLGDAREAISFNLSGPFVLMVCIWYFSNVELTRQQIRKLFITSIAPIVGILTIAAYSTFTSSSIQFGNEANFTTSGGFGPNQVSSILSLGALFAYFLILLGKNNPYSRILLFGILIATTAQSALTFSRSGLYMFGIGIFAASVFLVRDGKALFRNIVLFVLFYSLATFFLLPWLDGFTSGAFIQRIQNTSLTGRDKLMQADLRIWVENPILGVGPGVSTEMHKILFRIAASHTEYTRLLAEHGLLGLFAMILLVYLTVQSFLQAKPSTNKAIISAILVWFILYLSSSGMRLAAPSFLFGLAASRAFTQEDKEESAEEIAPDTQPRYKTVRTLKKTGNQTYVSR